MQVAESHLELAQVRCCFASSWWNTGLQQCFGLSHHPEGSFGGPQWQPTCLFSPWRGEKMCCSMANPWLTHQATTRQGVPGGTALCQSHQVCLRGMGENAARVCPQRTVKQAVVAGGWAHQATKQDLRIDLGYGQCWEGKANSGACQGTTVLKECWLCHISTAPSPAAGFCLSLKSDVLQVKRGKVLQACMCHLLPSKHHYKELSHLDVSPCLQCLNHQLLPSRKVASKLPKPQSKYLVYDCCHLSECWICRNVKLHILVAMGIGVTTTCSNTNARNRGKYKSLKRLLLSSTDEPCSTRG